ncbi:hypothetical protein L1987_37679 [Smallanthus sonchifolius]|uniref:Uncharacterized protein n=1 Tax=Smallanthus sonchifolius TaxID=185202 RepID=A0ACB9HIV3_9ASTR|nr:hypothetical protein L1987_37679 [Smallanthus sonchifolius]
MARVTAIADLPDSVFSAFDSNHKENCILAIDKSTLQVTSEIGRQSGNSSKSIVPGTLTYVNDLGLLAATAVTRRWRRCERVEMIPLMPSVSISISPLNSLKPSPNYSLQDVADRFIDRKKDYLPSLRPQIQNALLFLKKFHTIRSLDVLFITDDDDGFLPTFAQSVVEKSKEEAINDVTAEELELRLYSSFPGVVDSIEWGNVISCLVVQHPMLREITIVGVCCEE